ncbi:unnamed protein product [Chrysoparadoxa australica]
MFVEAYRRAFRSYESALHQYEHRVASGTQPESSWLGIDVFNVATQETLLVATNAFYMISIAALYVFMQRRKQPFNVTWIMRAFNYANMSVSAYVAWGIIRHQLQAVSEGRFFILCDPRNDQDGQAMAKLFSIFFLQKFLEFADTYFFILRKSFRQVTFLHLFHHSSITVVVGSALPFDFAGDLYAPILLNSLVHVLVYLHYMLASMGIQAWWSPFLTALQLGQFAFIFIQQCLAYNAGPLCGPHDFVKVLLIVYMSSMIVLFGVFFIQRYILKMDAADLCGVLKSIEPKGIGVASTWHGNAQLDAKGTAMVRLPRSFHESVGSVMYCYQLTAIGKGMPELHISQEITRSLKGHKFAVKGGAPQGRISWQISTVEVEDRVAH